MKDAGYCKTQQPDAYFCDDYDKGTLDPRWEVSVPNNATLTISDGGSTSPPFSLLHRAVSGQASPAADMSVSEDLSRSLTRRRVRADFLLQALDPAGHRTVLLTNYIGNDNVYLAVFDTGAELYEFRTNAPGQVALPSVPLNTWTTIELDLTVGAPTKVTVRYGAIEVLKDHPVGLSGGPQSRARGTLGIFINGTTTAETRIRSDNFVLQLLP